MKKLKKLKRRYFMPISVLASTKGDKFSCLKYWTKKTTATRKARRDLRKFLLDRLAAFDDE